MSFAGFAPDDRKLFARSAPCLAGPDLESLKGRLSDGVWESVPDSLVERLDQLGHRVSRDALFKAGRLELASLYKELPRRVRRVLAELLPHDALCSIRREAPGERVLASLQVALVSAERTGRDPILQAGLHRLARAIADLDPAGLHWFLSCLPDSHRSWVRSACLRLASLDEARAQAPRIRAEWPEGR